MADFLDVLESYANNSSDFGKFCYGDKSSNNLLRNSRSMLVGKNYWIVDPITREYIYSRDGGSISSRVYSGYFMILRPSSLDEVYYRNNDTDVNYSKFERYIRPLLRFGEDISLDLACEGVNVEMWKINEIINHMDENRDGIVVEYRVSIDA